MDRFLARRLETDEDFQKKVSRLAKDYLGLGQQSVTYYTEEFDQAHDLLMCYAPLSKADLEQLERGHPKRFILPMSATQITTMTTFIAQMLFGDTQPWKVEGRGPEDEASAEHVNQLLRWNAEQQPSYLLGYLWVQDILTYNRGIRYNSWQPVYETEVVNVEIEDPEDLDEEGNPKKYTRPAKRRKEVAAYNHIHLVSPYEFVCDPSIPLWRFQQGRFAGHRTLIPWLELEKRSRLSPDHPSYVLPSAVGKLKKKKKTDAGNIGMGTIVAGGGAATRVSATTSRTAFERNRSNANPDTTADKNDAGIVECHELYIRLIPSDNELYEGDEQVIFQVLVGNQDVVLAINESPNKHDQYPYSAAEGRPSAYYQYSPSWLMMLKPIQDYIDYLKNRRQQSIARTSGNMFIVRPDKVNIADFMDPDKDGLLIPILPDATSDRLDDIVKQVPVTDLTQQFRQEIQDFTAFSETVTGVNAPMQGAMTDDTTATQYVGTQQMSAGRLSSVARLISVQGLVPETRQIVSNFQQFLTTPMSLRFVPNGVDGASTFHGQRALDVSPDTIQGQFDFIAHDGSLPGTDARKVAAISRLLELVPVVPQYFQPAPGNIDARALILAGAKAAGLQVENFQFTPDTAAQEAAATMPPAPPEGAPPGPESPATEPVPTLPDLVGTPPANQGPGRPPTPTMSELPSAEPLQVRPQNAY